MSDSTTDKSIQDIFRGLVEQSEVFKIEYSERHFEYDDHPFVDFVIVSVNGFQTTTQFKSRIQELCKGSLKELKQFVSTIPFKDRLAFLERVREEVEGLQWVIDDDTQTFEESEYGPREVHNYKVSINATYNGQKADRAKPHPKSIGRKASPFAETWLDCIGELMQKIEFLINQIELLPDPKDAILREYVNLGRIKELERIKSTDYDLSRLLRFCEELNVASMEGNSFSVIMLVRSIIDHVPPIFGKSTFADVASQYGSQSFKASMNRLEVSSRKIADSALHQQIRKKETLPNNTQVNFSNDLDVLLEAIVRELK